MTLIASVCCLLLLSACKMQEQAALSSVTDHRKTLTVVTTPSDTSYFDNKGEADGFEYQLIHKFAQQQGYLLKLILTEDEQGIYQALDHGLADIAMIGHPLSRSKQEKYQRSPALMDITTQLIYRHGSGKPQTYNDLINKHIVVADNIQFREKYHYLKQQYPALDWTFVEKDNDHLLDQLNRGKIDYTLINSQEYLQKQSLYTHTRVAFDLYYPEPISWVWSQTVSEEKRDSVNRFLSEAKDNGTIKQLKERFYGHSDDINPRGSMAFFKRVKYRLPRYQKQIRDIAQQYDIDWRLLAAIAYQESHWNPQAKSPTGVRGMMMLTQGTASDMGIEDRLDLTQSLRGGAKYLKSMLRRVPKEVPYPDRTWFALAAYNVGLGHVKDAQKITDFHGGNPLRWADVKQHLPLLEKREWHRFTTYGFARGSEPVSYVQNIRHFNDLLEWRFPNKKANSNDLQHAKGISVENLTPEIIENAKMKQAKKQPTPTSKLSQGLEQLFFARPTQKG